MKIPINWLKQYITTRQNSKDIAKKLTAIGHMQDGPIKTVHGDQVIDLEVRQNRSDCLSIIGIARELGAIDRKRVLYPDNSISKIRNAKPSSWKIDIKDPDLCYRFSAIKIDNISIADSPKWLKQALLAYGMEPINNIVDITNFVMIESGQPLHAFDSLHIQKNLIIRRAKKGEQFVSLGEKKFSLTPDDLVIANEKEILAMAGVIGGNNSGVKPSTTSIVLEAANYNQASVRRSSIRHSIRTEASLRLEKFLSPEYTVLALSRALYLIQQICGGTIANVNDAYPKSVVSTKIKLSLSFLQKLSGVNINKTDIKSILSHLEFEDTKFTTDTVSTTVPSFRTDVTNEEDLIEEIVRIHGYDKIPSLLPSVATSADIQSNLYDFEEQIRDIMSALGFDEHITEPLTDKNDTNKTPIKLQNSLTSEKQQLRTTLKHNLVKVKENYLKHRRTDIKVYEIGKIYYQTKKYVEEHTLGVLLSSPKASYADIQGVLETLSAQLGRNLKRADFTIAPLDPNTFYAEVSIERLYANKQKEPITVFTTPPKLVFQDLSLTSPIDINVASVLESIKSLDARIFEVVLGEETKPIDSKSKSLFIKMSFRHPENTNIDKKQEEEIRKRVLDLLKTLNIKLLHS